MAYSFFALNEGSQLLAGFFQVPAAVQKPKAASVERQQQEDEYTRDGTVDFHGRPFLREKGGRWPASFFILISEAFERVAYCGIASNLVVYQTDELHQGTVTSANYVTNWVGVAMMTSLFAAYLADAYLGRYRTLVISSLVYFLGMVLLTVTVSLPSLKPQPCDQLSECADHTKPYQLVVFYFSLLIMALGMGGTKVNSAALGADQFDVADPKEKAEKVSFFNWWSFAICSGNLFSSIFIVYIEEKVSWAIGYATATGALAVSIVFFFIGTPLYRHKMSSGSPFTRIAQVFVAAIRKWRLPLPPNHTTSSIMCFDKAAVELDSHERSPWLLCSVTQVEEAKQITKVLSIFIVTIMPSVMTAQVLTLFIMQGNTLERSLGPHFKTPSASVIVVFNIATLAGVTVYDRWFMPLMARGKKKNPRGITMLQRIGIGLAMHITIMLEAALVERFRLVKAKDHQNSVVPLTILVIMPQFALMGIAEVFVTIGKMEFFYDQSPEGMKSLGASLFASSFGIGNFLSSFLLSMVSKITRKGGRKGWIRNNLNESHLDYYYVFLALLNALNLALYLIASKFYVYKYDAAWSMNMEEKEDQNQC